jgi:hypothetical protein
MAVVVKGPEHPLHNGVALVSQWTQKKERDSIVSAAKCSPRILSWASRHRTGKAKRQSKNQQSNLD